MSWTLASCESTPPVRLADPLFRMAPCGRASSPSTYGRLVTPGFAAPDRLELEALGFALVRYGEGRRGIVFRHQISLTGTMEGHPKRGGGKRELRAAIA
jgi:hypothetical protein